MTLIFRICLGMFAGAFSLLFLNTAQRFAELGDTAGFWVSLFCGVVVCGSMLITAIFRKEASK